VEYRAISKLQFASLICIIKIAEWLKELKIYPRSNSWCSCCAFFLFSIIKMVV